MLITPSISNDTASRAQKDPALLAGLKPRRESAAAAIEQAVPQPVSLPPQTAGAGAAEPADASPDLIDAGGADALMNSLLGGILAQPGAAMQAQANLSPQSVYDLVQ